MTAVLDELRQLDLAYERGELTREERDARKSDVMDRIPEAFEPMPTLKPPKEARFGIGHMIVLGLSVIIFFTGLAILISAEFELALTFGITVLAALTVALFRQLDEE